MTYFLVLTGFFFGGGGGGGADSEKSLAVGQSLEGGSPHPPVVETLLKKGEHLYETYSACLSRLYIFRSNIQFSDKWVVGQMGCLISGLSDKWICS